MNDIFDRLKNEPLHKRRNSVYPMSGADTATFVPPSTTATTESFGRNVTEAPRAPVVTVARSFTTEEELIPVEEFDLSRATTQLQRAMDPGTIIGEQLRILRTRLSLMQKQEQIRTIMVTSTVPQEGKSFTAYALAGVIAQEHDKRVVLIDADLRKRGSGREYGLNLKAGIIGTAQVLQGMGEFRKSLLKSNNPEFWFLPSGALPPNPSELLSSSEMEKMIHYAAGRFDWVIVDAPPALALSDPNLLAPLCDKVVFVVRANSTPAKLAQEAINKIGQKNICGIVLNRKRQIHSSRHYYQYYYQKKN